MTKTSSVIAMIGAPFADGQDLCGVELAPNAMRQGGLKTVVEKLGWTFEDCGDLVPVNASEKANPSTDGAATGAAHKSSKSFTEDEDPYVLNVKNAAIVGANNGNLHEAVYNKAKENKFVLTVGGDHALASATISGLLRAHPNLAVIWVDAHGDCNTPETSPSGNYHGMPAAHVLGWFKRPVEGFAWLKQQLPESNLCFIALRDLDDSEKEMLKNSKVTSFSMKDVDRLGISRVMDIALEAIDPQKNRPLHLSLDIDAVDPIYAPGTGTKARGGLTFREVHYICEAMADTNRLVGMDMVEINPALDPVNSEEMHGDDPSVNATVTVRLGIDLVASALGKNIL